MTPAAERSPMITTCRLTRNARRLARDPQAMHRTIAHALGERGLWAMPDQHTLIVQHQQPVCWHTSMDGVIAHSHTTPIPQHHTGDRIRWAMVANPTTSTPVDGGRGTVKPLDDGQWDDWCIRKLSPALAVDSLDHQALPTLAGIKPSHRIIHRRACFTGTGTVRDIQLLDRLRLAGIGRGKAYGCGLLVTGVIP